MPDIRRAIYPGTFDPITNGHLDVLARAAEMFDEVIVAITTANGKNPLFTEAERKVVAEKAVKEVLPEKKNITVDTFSGLIVDYAKSKKAIALIRGLRAVSDFEYEMQMALMNRKLSDISTVFLAPHERYTYLNSSIVRELVKYGGDISPFVPKSVADAIQKRS
jgi:pantetheine-phosphate adenylyltransferase